MVVGNLKFLGNWHLLFPITLLIQVPPSSSKFNPKDSEKTSESKKHKEKSSKVDVFSMSFEIEF